MPVETTVGPPVITINQGDTFMVADENGEIASGSEMGIFSGDTRFLSHYRIFADGVPWERLSSAAINYFSATFHLLNKEFESGAGVIEAGTLSLRLIREVVDRGIAEELRITNYAAAPVRFYLEIALRSDFADIFEVRAHRYVRRGNIETTWNSDQRELRTTYKNLEFSRTYFYQLADCSTPVHLANGRVIFDIDLPPHGQWQASCLHELAYEGSPRLSRSPGEKTRLDKLHSEWQTRATKITSSNEEVYRFFTRSVEDMGALRLYEQEPGADSFTPAAGVPWYVALFGRDSLIASLQTSLVNSKFALGTLQRLADHQAAVIDDWRDAEPGKILHELRQGELVKLGKVPHSPYYGTADATPLYLVVLHETWKWVGHKSIIESYRDVALRCLEWIDKYGDLDGDGLQEYKVRSKQGYENVCWKDSPDAIMYADGSRVHQPKGTCELQGYVFDAWMRMAEVFDALGETERSAELRRKAKALQKKFLEKYWSDEIQFVALALDANKQQAQSVASNVGHCLWSGILPEEYARRCVERLMKDDMMSGWGVRTLSAAHPAFNPHSYHRGSVWPHDNGILALGLKRYGFAQEVSRVFRDISEAASMFSSHRIPELYAGIQRENGSFPVQYSGANVPQAWAAGSVFHLLQALLGLQADAPNGVIYVDPVLPRWLPDVRLQGLAVGESMVDIEFYRERDKSLWNATVREGKLRVEQKKWAPWKFE